MWTTLGLVLVLSGVPESIGAVPDGGTVASITRAGGVAIRDGTFVPPLFESCRWTDLGEKSSTRYETHHFICTAPASPPAIELYVTTDKGNDPPDGLFEIGLVRGFLSGFASKAGLEFGNPVFDDRLIGASKVKHTLVKLSGGNRTLWVHAYIYPRQTSLTFIAIKAKDGEQEGIEKYLSKIEMK